MDTKYTKLKELYDLEIILIKEKNKKTYKIKNNI